jgi:hypothetical protein
MPQELHNLIDNLEAKLTGIINHVSQPGVLPVTANNTLGPDIGDSNRDILSKEMDTDIYHFELVMNRFNLGFYPFFFLKNKDENKEKLIFEESIVVSNSGDDEGDFEDNVGLYLASLFGVLHDGHVESILVGPDMDTINKIIEQMIKSGLFRDDVRLHFLKTDYGFVFQKNQLEFKSKKSLSEQIHQDLQGKTVKTDSGNTMPAYDHLLKALEEKLLLLV